MATQRLHQRLLLGGLEDVVVLDVASDRVEPTESLVERLLVGVVEDVELELGGDAECQPQLGGALHLRLKDLPRGYGERVVILALDVAQDEGRLVEPGDHDEGRVVGPDHEVPVAKVPGEKRVAGERIVFDVAAQQIVASFPALVGLCDVGATGIALAREPSLLIGEDGEEGVDRSLVDQTPQFGEADGLHSVSK